MSYDPEAYALLEQILAELKELNRKLPSPPPYPYQPPVTPPGLPWPYTPIWGQTLPNSNGYGRISTNEPDPKDDEK